MSLFEKTKIMDWIAWAIIAYIPLSFIPYIIHPYMEEDGYPYALNNLFMTINSGMQFLLVLFVPLLVVVFVLGISFGFFAWVLKRKPWFKKLYGFAILAMPIIIVIAFFYGVTQPTNTRYFYVPDQLIESPKKGMFRPVHEQIDMSAAKVSIALRGEGADQPPFSHSILIEAKENFKQARITSFKVKGSQHAVREIDAPRLKLLNEKGNEFYFRTPPFDYDHNGGEIVESEIEIEITDESGKTSKEIIKTRFIPRRVISFKYL